MRYRAALRSKKALLLTAGAGALVIGSALALAVQGPREAGEPTPSDSSVASPSPSPTANPISERTASPDVTAFPTPTAPPESPDLEPAPSASPLAIPVDSLVRTTAETLGLRSGPGLGEELLGRLPIDTTAFVVGGPLQSDGRPWYLLAGLGLPDGSGCTTDPSSPMVTCPAWNGWVAGASSSGTAWLESTDLPCPAVPSQVEDLGEVPYALRLYCFGGDTFALDGFLRANTYCQAAGIAPGSLSCAGSTLVRSLGFASLTLGPELGTCGGDWPSDSACSASSMAGEWVRASVTVDHPAAASCASGSTTEDAVAVFQCRALAVITAIEIASAPVAEVGNPQAKLALVGTEDYETSAGQWTRYRLTIENWVDFPPELFEISTSYPCGQNPTASRTIVDIYNAATETRIYGFCALAQPSDLTIIWFAVARGTDPPPGVVVWMTDQLTGARYRSTVVHFPIN
jgi:hypothetical protein